tara:strand:+ start:308 stop:1372 length:1065 start_codon:yes stop_codon:yes gene_type:complete
MAHLFRHFPREMDMRKRKVVHDMDGLQHYVKATNGADNLTTTVYGFRELKPNGHRGEYSTAIIPHFVMDLDYERALTGGKTAKEAGNKCLQETYALHQHLLSNDWKHAMFFTGGGVHIWVNLSRTYHPEGSEMSDLLVSGRRMIDGWVKEWNLSTLDPVVSFRPDRHIRIPNTYNFKRGLWGMPLTTNDLENGWDSIVKKANVPHDGMVLYGTQGLELNVIKRNPSKPFSAEPVEVIAERINNITVLPCIGAASCVKGGNPPHEARTFLVMFLQDRLRNFARPPRSSPISPDSIEETIHSFIKKLDWADYKKSETTKYVNHSVNQYYRTPSCRTLYERGYCIGRCSFYDGSGGV